MALIKWLNKNLPSETKAQWVTNAASRGGSAEGAVDAFLQGVR
jgi:hypothetical protein